jgi:peptide-methionine (R)-S-oxide reductase
MNRIHLIAIVGYLLLGLSACQAQPANRAKSTQTPSTSTPKAVSNTPDTTLTLTDAEWRARLTPTEYAILREKGTERPYTGEYLNTKTVGTYHCRACDAPLFQSTTKFDSHCGWPSFYASLPTVVTHQDLSHGMVRDEILCKRCGGHLGHVFEDGPEPTGLRYCVNSVSIVLKPATAADNAPVVNAPQPKE